MQSNLKKLPPREHFLLLKLSVQLWGGLLLPLKYFLLLFSSRLLRIMPLISKLTSFCPLAFIFALVCLTLFHITFHARFLILFISKNLLKMNLSVWVSSILVQAKIFKKFLLISFELLRIKFNLIYAVLDLMQYLWSW